VPAKSREEHLHETGGLFGQGTSSKSFLIDSFTPSTSHLKVGFAEELLTDSIRVIFRQFVDSSNLTAPNE
jgi:hypothetical protein